MNLNQYIAQLQNTQHRMAAIVSKEKTSNFSMCLGYTPKSRTIFFLNMHYCRKQHNNNRWALL